MKSNEIRVGNIIQDSNRTLHEVLPSHILAMYQCEQAGTDLGFEPIPLTEEWLVKFGFEKRGENGKNGWYSILYDSGEELSELGYNVKSNRIYIVESDEGIAIGYSNAVHSVHQLQNLYYALTGEELTLNETV